MKKSLYIVTLMNLLISLAIYINLAIETEGEKPLPAIALIYINTFWIAIICILALMATLYFKFKEETQKFFIVLFWVSVIFLTWSCLSNIISVQGTYNEKRFIEVLN